MTDRSLGLGMAVEPGSKIQARKGVSFGASAPQPIVVSETEDIYQELKDGKYTGLSKDSTMPWNAQVTARDILHNISSDRQGTRIPGSSITIQPTDGETSEITVSVPVVSSPERFRYSGFSKAGHNHIDGEGVRHLVLSLLRDHGAKEVSIRSGNYQLDFYLTGSGGLNMKMSLKDEIVDGTELKFETSSKELVQALKERDQQI